MLFTRTSVWKFASEPLRVPFTVKSPVIVPPTLSSLAASASVSPAIFVCEIAAVADTEASVTDPSTGVRGFESRVSVEDTAPMLERAAACWMAVGDCAA